MTTINARGRQPAPATRRGAAAAAPLAGPDPDLVRCRAYEIFLARGGAPGDQVSDWLSAERELADRSGGPAADARSRGQDAARGLSESGAPPVRDGILDNHD